jgi:hypothetical protein
VRLAARVVGGLGVILASSVLAVPNADAATVGKQRVLVTLVSYGERPFTRASVTDTFAQADAFLRRSSFGRLSLQTTVTQWIEGALPMPQCGAGEPAFGQLRTVPISAGFDPSAYDRAVYVVSGERCGFTGISRGEDVLLVSEPDVRLVVHELGHTFGLPHAQAAATCTSWCVTQEQGDLFSPMGSGFTDFGAYEKEQLGWIPRQPRVTKPGNYTVAPRRAGPSRQALVLETPEGEYWLEQRPDTQTPALIVRVVHPDVFGGPWSMAPSTLLLAPIREGHPTIVRGQTFRVPGAFAARVGRTRTEPMRLRLSLAAGYP